MILWLLVWSVFALLGPNGVVGGTNKHPTDDRLDCVLNGKVDRRTENLTGNFYDISTESKISKEECLRRGCLWEETTIPDTPWCFLDKHQPSYRVKSPTSTKTATGFESRLSLQERSEERRVGKTG